MGRSPPSPSFFFSSDDATPPPSLSVASTPPFDSLTSRFSASAPTTCQSQFSRFSPISSR